MRLVNDHALREGFRRGDRYALTEVYREYAPALFDLLAKGFAFESKGRRVGFAGFARAGDLEGTVQEVFVRAFAPEARQRYDGLHAYKNYLFAIARNIVADTYRRRTREFVPAEELQSEEVTRAACSAEPPAQVDADIENRQLEALLGDFVADLDGLQRAVFDARFRGRQSIEAAAASLQVTAYRVKRTEKWLRKRLFCHLRQHGYLEGYGSHKSLASTVGLLSALAPFGGGLA